jgi:hypothetical protein
MPLLGREERDIVEWHLGLGECLLVRFVVF